MNSKDLISLNQTSLNLFKTRRIKLINMPDDPNPIPNGAMGTIVEICPMPNEEIQVVVNWENKRSLNLICPPDEFELMSYEPRLHCYQCDVETTWLAPDSRCGSCTRHTPDEIRGDV
jgi:hypothetical protein